MSNKNDVTNVSSNQWMIKPCEMYKDEYKECKSIKARFHQYYMTGETSDCTQWKVDFDNCKAFKEMADETAAIHLVDSELSRRQHRLDNARANNVWEYRTSPPEEWAAPLPEYLERMRLPSITPQQQQQQQQRGSACAVM